MNAAAVMWAVTGLAAGGAHAMALWRAAHHIAVGGFGLVGLRMVAVVTVLVAAAYAGSLFFAVTGWLIGLLVTTVLYVGMERWSM